MVDLDVVTRDVWTLQGGVGFRRSGGANTVRFEVQDVNFLGAGKGISLQHESSVDRTTNLVSYTSVFNPISPTVNDTMSGSSACYRDFTGSLQCPTEMFGANAPGSTWNVTFQQADLGPLQAFGSVPKSSGRRRSRGRIRSGGVEALGASGTST